MALRASPIDWRKGSGQMVVTRPTRASQISMAGTGGSAWIVEEGRGMGLERVHVRTASTLMRSQGSTRRGGFPVSFAEYLTSDA